MDTRTLALVTSALAFLSAALFTYAFGALLGRLWTAGRDTPAFRAGLRGGVLERSWQTLVEGVARMLVERDQLGGTRARVRRDLVRAGRGNDRPEAFLALQLVRGALALGIAYVALAALQGTLLPFPVLILAAVVFAIPVAGLRDAADRRIARITRRLPYSIDLVALSMEAGGGFEESAGILIRDAPDEPLHQEFDQVLRDRNLGVSRQEALQHMAERIEIDDFRNLVLALNMGDQLGTPVVKTLRIQGDAIRHARIQRAEKLAREAAPKMALPNTLIMVANVLLIIGPILLKLSRGGTF